MHGLINRSIECFVRDTYGDEQWARVAQDLGAPGFEPMLHYPDALTDTALASVSALLSKPLPVVLEDIGSYLVTVESLRRLLRFGGTDFVDFILSLSDLPGRSRMALPDLDLPRVWVEEWCPRHFRVTIAGSRGGWGAVMAGLLRAMADDYGALVLVAEPAQAPPDQVSTLAPDLRATPVETVEVEMLDSSFASGRRFDLARRGVQDG